MTKEQLIKWIDTGRELEFSYNGKNYSITYYGDGRKDYISFCEFDDALTLDVDSADALWDSSYKGMKLSDTLPKVKCEDISVF
jgi:hypothetical protein